MRPSLRSLIFLYWIYAFAGGLIGVFTQIYLYQKFTSLSLNVIATMVFYTGIMVGFTVPGILATYLRLNIKRGFLWSFIAMAAAILYLLRIDSVASAYLAMFFWGFGNGIYWLTVNTFELTETKDEERDFYSSILNAGNQILSFVGPASATALIWLSQYVFHTGTFTLLFTVAPTVYLLGFFCFKSIRDYYPPRIEWADVKHFFVDRRNQAAQVYTLGNGIEQTLGVTIPPLATLFILGTVLKVGIYSTFAAIFSAVCILFVARYRKPSRRLLIYGLTMIGIVLATAWLGYAFTLTALIIYTAVLAFLSPLQNISTHVFDLKIMEVGRKETDFYATMILRDIALWFWRCVGGALLLVLFGFFAGERTLLSIGLYLLAGSFLLRYFGAFLLLRVKSF